MALEKLMEIYGSTVLRTAYFYTGDQYLAEDVSQEVFIRAYRNWNKFRGEINYTSGNKVFTVMEDMRQAGFRFDTFESIQVNGVDGFVNAMLGLTELYWLKDGIQFSIVGPITQEEAMKVAESLK